MVLIRPEPLSLKFVALKVAMPLVVPSALALSIVIVPLAPEELARVMAPLWRSILLTPPAPVQVWKVGALAPLDTRQSPLLPWAICPMALLLLAKSISLAVKLA